MGVEDKPGTAFKIFNTLAKHNINVDIILQSVGRDGTKDITFTVSQDDLKEAMEVMEARKEALTIKEMNYNEKVAKVSIVGAGMLSNPGVAATMFESLSNSNININMISTSEIRITVLIDEKDADVHWLQSMTDLVWKTNKKNVVANVPDGAFAGRKKDWEISQSFF